ncbi:hypothetical protein BS47DRAFT_1343285 [Hydnum rufescens UP504]|uniref:Uncharacterized protein n=1 Tax=Hydnum rufescens UP504 TaxID=1448309 RepID=A0A9P6AZF9_9AGAM|nr:hypothetical protein BS47DRAFT_1343285 [Hydnum rufescens UP504]
MVAQDPKTQEPASVKGPVFPKRSRMQKDTSHNGLEPDEPPDSSMSMRLELSARPSHSKQPVATVAIVTTEKFMRTGNGDVSVSTATVREKPESITRFMQTSHPTSVTDSNIRRPPPREYLLQGIMAQALSHTGARNTTMQGHTNIRKIESRWRRC